LYYDALRFLEIRSIEGDRGPVRMASWLLE